MEVRKSRSAKETACIAAQFLKAILRKKEYPVVLALSGDLGSGKTTFVQALARGLGLKEKIQSPTFVLAKWYSLAKRLAPLRHFVHIDAYRIDSPAEAKHIGILEAIHDREALVVIEWADRVRRLIPKKAIWIYFVHGPKNKRVIRYEATRFN